MNHGLSEATVDKICGVFIRFPSVEKAVLYGSRAKGTFKPGSDIDLTLLGDSLTSAELGAMADELDELLLPYQIDLSIFHHIHHEGLREHIERVGKVLYEKHPRYESKPSDKPQADVVGETGNMVEFGK